MKCTHHPAEHCNCRKIEERRNAILNEFGDVFMEFAAGRHRYIADYREAVGRLSLVYRKVKEEFEQ